MQKSITIDKKKIGNKAPCYIVAELSANHNGKIAIMKKLIRDAKKAGANAVKIQAYQADTITLNSTLKDFKIVKKNQWSKYKNLYSLYKKGETPFRWYKELFKYCKKYKITIFASVFDKKSIDILEKLNCPAYKIASPEITDIPLIEYAAKTNKPIILSNGLANYNDLLLAYNCIKRKKNNKIIILKCTSSYPAKKNKLNLRTMGDIKKKFKVNSGFSDHTIGIDSAIYAASIGADMIEKHITLDQKIKTIDSFFSLKIKKFKLMIDKIRENEKSYGKINYNIAKESKINLNGRRSLYVINYIKKNEKFTSKNIKSIRPSYGLHPKFFSKIIGKFAKKDLPQGTRLKWSLIKKNN